MNVIFMGTPDFAVPTLEAIKSSSHNITAIFTQNPKPKNRGLKKLESPIHLLGNSYQIPVYTPLTLKTNEVFERINQIEADIIIVAAYGFIIPANILYSKKYGSINLHPSKLPRFRGAAPLQHTIIAGDKESAICVMQMDEGLDTGDILLQKNFSLPKRPTIKWLHDYCAKEGAQLVLEVLDNIESITPVKQSCNNIKYASKLSKIDGLINWNLDAMENDCKIRGMALWPGTYFHSNVGDVKIIEAEPVLLNHNEEPGKILDSKEMIISCKSDAIKILKLQLPGKTPISNIDFMNGYPELVLI